MEIVKGWVKARLAAASSDLRLPDRVADPDRNYMEVAAAARILDAIEDGSLPLPDPAARVLLDEMASFHDEDARYEEVVKTHDALHAFAGLLRDEPSAAPGFGDDERAEGGRGR
jgi:hypothetical protein